VASRGTRAGSARTVARGAAALAMQVDAEAAEPWTGKDPSAMQRLAVDPPRVRRQRRQDGLLDIHAVERPVGQGRTRPSTRIDGAAPATSSRSLPPASSSVRSQRSRRPCPHRRLRRARRPTRAVLRSTGRCRPNPGSWRGYPTPTFGRRPRPTAYIRCPSYRGAAHGAVPSTRPRRAAPRS
jgi:hypothetical protein